MTSSSSQLALSLSVSFFFAKVFVTAFPVGSITCYTGNMFLLGHAYSSYKTILGLVFPVHLLNDFSYNVLCSTGKK